MLFPRNFVKSVKALMLEGGKDALVDATAYPASGSFIDTNGFDHVVFLIGLDTVAAPDFKVQQATAANGTPKDLTGATKTDIVTADDGKWLSIEFPVAALDTANAYRYVTLVTANITTDYANLWCFLYRARETPVTQDANYLEGVIVGG